MVPFTTLPSNLAPPMEIGAYNGVFIAFAGLGGLLAPGLGGAVLATGASPLAVWSILVAPVLPAALILRSYVTPRLRAEANVA